MVKACRTQNYEKVWSNLVPGLSMNLREQIAELLEQTADKKVGKVQKTFRVSEELKPG